MISTGGQRTYIFTTDYVEANGTVGGALTLTLPAYVGKRHYLCAVHITRMSTLALGLIASATPQTITTTNCQAGLNFYMGADASILGTDKTVMRIFGTGYPCVALNTPTTFTAPAVVGAQWRMAVTYRLGD